MTDVERLGRSAFEGERLQRPGTWAVAFLADWCPFCRSFGPEFEGLGGPGAHRLAIADISEVDDPRWETFHIDVVPTVIVFRDGASTARRDGVLGRGLADADLAALRAELERA
ncbi:MAG TPA: thioredoxin family protein [Thermoplasmata archaeon]|nr:thioredoxin family protein [Thermoplasmata archaeon]